MEEDINVLRFNGYYRFYDVWVDPKDVVNYVVDPNCLVLSVDLHTLIHWFRFFFLKDLKLICRAHGLHPAQLTKPALKHLMYSHVCPRRCADLVYIFKLLPRQRPHIYGYFEDAAIEDSFHVSASELDQSASVVPEPVVPLPASTLQSNTEPNTVQSGCRDHADESQVDKGINDVFEHLKPLDDARKAAIISEWEETMSTDMLKPLVCAVCSICVLQRESVWVSAAGVELKLLQNPYIPKEILPRTYDFELYDRALLNPKGLQYTDRLGFMRLCIKCHKSLLGSKMPKFALSNWLYYGYDSLPSDVKDAFDSSTVFDRMLIGRARANSITCRFNAKRDTDNPDASEKDSILDRARRGVRGNILVAPLNTVRMNRVIPPPSSALKDTMCAMFIGQKLPTKSMLKRYPPVLVKRSRVRTMIAFLLEHNSHYRPSETFGYSEENLNSLFDNFEDEAFPSGVHVGYMPRNDAVETTVADYTRRNDVEDGQEDGFDEILMENVGYTEGDDSPAEYLRMKAIALERCLSGKPFIASGTGVEILPDFKNPSILTWLFPHLDPWGIGGFNHPGRVTRIGLQEQLRHLLMVDSSPFQRDPEFAFVFYNVCRKALVSESIAFSVSSGMHKSIARRLLSIDPGVLTTLETECRKNPFYRPTRDADKEAFNLLSSLKMVSKRIPGSDGYKAA